MEEGQYLRYHGFYLVWLLLAELCRAADLPKLALGEAPVAAAIVAYLFMWGCFTLVLFVATLRLNRALQAVFLTLTVLFFLLAVGDLTGSTLIKTIAGLEGICAA